MKILKGNLQSVIELLQEIPLSRKSSRMRTKFVKHLNNEFINLQEDIRNIQKEYFIFENGEPVVEELNGELIYKCTDRKLMNEDINQLLKEVYTIESNDNNKEILESVKYSIENYEAELTGEKADVYNLLCDILDELED